MGNVSIMPGCAYRCSDSDKVGSIDKKFSSILKNRLKSAKKRQLVIVRNYFSLLFHQTPSPLTAVAIEVLIIIPSTTKTPPRLMKKVCARASSAVDPVIVYQCVKVPENALEELKNAQPLEAK
jgi:hypothetical protein